MCQKSTPVRENITKCPFVIYFRYFIFLYIYIFLYIFRYFYIFIYFYIIYLYILLYILDIFRPQISIHTFKLDMPKKYSRCRKYQTNAFDKVSGNGLLLYGLDIFRFKIFIHTIKLDVIKGTPIGENIRQFLLSDFLHIFRFQISIHTLKLDLTKKYSRWRKYQTMAFCYMV